MGIQKREDFWDFIYQFKHVLNGKDLEMVGKYAIKEADKIEKSRYIEDDIDDEGLQVQDTIEKLDELNNDFRAEGSDCFNHCSEEKIECLGQAVQSMLCYES